LEDVGEGLPRRQRLGDLRLDHRLQKQLANDKLLIIDELGFVPLSKTGAELLFELIPQRYERGATLITSNLPFDEWTETFGSERLTGALLDRLTHHVQILVINARQLSPRAQPRPKGNGQSAYPVFTASSQRPKWQTLAPPSGRFFAPPLTPARAHADAFSLTPALSLARLSPQLEPLCLPLPCAFAANSEPRQPSAAP
jgi:hypothetical protein